VPILIVNGLRNLMIRIIFLNQKEAVPLFKIFNPQNNTWTNGSQTNGYGVRNGHSAVCTGSEMIVWGNSTGHSSTSPLANGEKIYNSQTNTRYLSGLTIFLLNKWFVK